MRGTTSWAYKPFFRLHEIHKATLPYICRIAPHRDSFEFEWFDRGSDGAHKLMYRKYCTMDAWAEASLNGPVFELTGLICDMDYEFKVVRTDGSGESDVRLVRTCDMPYNIVNYLHPDDPIYQYAGHGICSPTIVRLPSGKLIAGMDVCYWKAGRNLSLFFKSEDNGKTWRYLCDMFPAWWPKLFVHRGKLYLFAASSDYGDMLIGCSEDEGETWSAPVRLIPGCGISDVGPHKSVVPVIEHKGRLWSGIDYGSWKYNRHDNGMLSIDVDADLMEPSNWQYPPFLPFDKNWEGAPVGPCPGCIEGNAVVSPDGTLCSYLRIDLPNCTPAQGKAVVLKSVSDDPEAPLALDRIVDCPIGSNAKFEVQRDPVTGKYIALGNEQDGVIPGRTVMSMAVSDDFYTWRIAKRLLDYRHADPNHVAFQYPDWYFDGEDIVYLSRTAWGRSFNSHDTNYITIHRIENFRQYL